MNNEQMDLVVPILRLAASQVEDLAVQVGALRHACESALRLLEDPDADMMDAAKVEKLLRIVLGEFDGQRGTGEDSHSMRGSERA
jgi:hypothetical protein